MAKKKRSAKNRESLHMLIVEARFYDNISDELLRGATRALDGGRVRVTIGSPSLARWKFLRPLRLPWTQRDAGAPRMTAWLHLAA